MDKGNDILVRISEKKSALSSKQQQLADYILRNYKTAAFQNSTKLAKLAGVSGSTVIRFAEELGYRGFPDMKSALHRILQKEINTVEAFLSTDEDEKTITIKGGFFQPCIDSFQKAEKYLSMESIGKAAEMLASARNVYIVGFLGSSFLAEYMSYFLSRIRKDVFRINTWDNAFFNLMPEGDFEQDVALIYAFPRFPDMTLRLAEFFSKHKVPMVCLTTIYQNQISDMAELSIGVDIEYRTYVDHMTPVLYVSEVLAKKVSKLSPKDSVKQLERFEGFTRDMQIFTPQ